MRYQIIGWEIYKTRITLNTIVLFSMQYSFLSVAKITFSFMLQNRNILCISNPLWEGDYAKTIVELMSIFATSNKVLYIDNPYTIKDILDGVLKKKKVPLKRALGLSSRLRKIQLNDTAHVYVLTPPVILTINFLPKGSVYKKLLMFNGWLVTQSIRRSLKKLNMNDRLINITAFNPTIGVATARKFNENLLIYHCYDAIEAANWMKKHGAWLEKEFMQIADAVIVTSQGLYEKKKDFCRACFLVKNAVNIDLFTKAFKTEINNKKIIGYIGSIDDRIDFDLLDQLIKFMPDTEFVFVGRIVDKTGEEILRKHPNVKLEGPKSVKDLPGYLSSFAMGIIPFAKNEFNKGVYPLKVNEYLAAGLPVVTTDFGYLQDFENVIRIADSTEKFKAFTLEEINNDSAERKLQRLNFARQNSWEQRVEEISGIIEKLEK